MSRTPRLGRVATGAVLALSLSVLGACGADDQAEDSALTGQEAAEPSTVGETDPTESAAEGEEISAAELVKVAEAAFEDATTASISMSTEGALALSLSGQADFTTDPPSLAMSMDDPTSDETLEIVLIDESIFVKVPQLGDKYLEADLNAAGNPLLAGGAELLDPRSLLGSLEEGITTASYLGEEEVDGEALDRYTFVVDSQALLDSLGGEGAAGEIPDIPEGVLPDEVAYDAYFDDEGNFRRMSADLGDLIGVIDARFDDWGDPVDISAPPPDQVEEFELGKLGLPQG